MYDERGCEKMELNQFHFYSSFISVDNEISGCLQRGI